MSIDFDNHFKTSTRRVKSLLSIYTWMLGCLVGSLTGPGWLALFPWLAGLLRSDSLALRYFAAGLHIHTYAGLFVHRGTHRGTTGSLSLAWHRPLAAIVHHFIYLAITHGPLTSSSGQLQTISILLSVHHDVLISLPALFVSGINSSL